MAKLVWRLKLITELEPGMVSETEVARIERDDLAVPETLGLTLEGGKQLTAATQAEIVRAQVSTMGERLRWCEHCEAKLLSKGYYPAMFRSVMWTSGSAAYGLAGAARERRSQGASPPCSPQAVWRRNWPISRRSSLRSYRSPGVMLLFGRRIAPVRIDIAAWNEKSRRGAVSIKRQ